MYKSVIGILVGIVVALIGFIVGILESFNTEAYWIGVGIFFLGIGIISLFILAKTKKWF